MFLSDHKTVHQAFFPNLVVTPEAGMSTMPQSPTVIRIHLTLPGKDQPIRRMLYRSPDGWFCCPCGETFLDAEDVKRHALANTNSEHPTVFPSNPGSHRRGASKPKPL